MLTVIEQLNDSMAQGKKKNYWLTLFLFKKFTINKINKKLSANCVESRARFQHTKRQGKVKNF